MIRASIHIPAGHWNDPASDSITLGQDQRDRRRIALTSDKGIAFLLDLPEQVLLRHGDGLVLEDGRIIEIQALPEPLQEVRAKDTPHLLRLAWHLGNRHLEAQIEPDRILIRRDRVIADMLERLGAKVSKVVEPFNPEGGAYGQAASAQAHGHDHGHGHDHADGHGDNHGHGDNQGHDHDH